MHVSIFHIKRVMVVSVIFGNDVIAAAILKIWKSVWTLMKDINNIYLQLKFQVNPSIIGRVTSRSEKSAILFISR